MNKDHVRKIGLSMAAAAARGDAAAVQKWAMHAIAEVTPALAAGATEPVAVHSAPIGPVAVPVVTGEWYNPVVGVEGSPQNQAATNPDSYYLPPGFGQGGEWLPGYTWNSAREWWAKWFASPWDMRLADPAYLPGSLVLTEEEGKRAVEINKHTLPAPPPEVPPNPNLWEGSSTLAIIRDMIAAGLPAYPPFAPGVTFPTTRPHGGT